jgi:Ca2+-binding EF-hand superfamily protein
MDVNGIGLSALSGYMGGWGQKATGDISQRVAAHIAELDADGDGALSVEESEVSAELFNQADSDGDGFVTEEELLAMMQKVRPEGPPPQEIENIELAKPDGEELASRILSRRDADGDGVLTLEESGVDAAAFSKADTNGDGLVTKEELVAMVGGGKPEGRPSAMDGEMGPPPGGSVGDMAAAIMEELDSDSDGGLSSSEAGASEEEFDALDTNKDGVVSQAELEAAMTTIMGAVQQSGLGFGAEAVNAAGGMAAYRQEMDRLILGALTVEESDSSDSTGILAGTGSTGTIDLTA